MPIDFRKPLISLDFMKKFAEVGRKAQNEFITDAELADFLGMPRRTVAYHRFRLGLPPVRRKNRKRGKAGTL